VHGIFQNCVAGLLSVRDLCPARRVIAPSRFGYLGSSVPPEATPAAQADAFVALLDALDISQIDVIGLSAGTTSALQLGLRHPEKVKDLLPSTLARLAGVPREFTMTARDAQFVTEFIDSLFPVRRQGPDFDAFVSNADVNGYNLEAIKVPTLIVHTEDDPLASHEASRRAAERIPGARFVSLESGGHLMLGQTEKIRNELAHFFSEGKPRPSIPRP
jgi:pimeloyl-ACP methyl ester carboxylesterase